jgi:catechol 2,3-dioxygenase-like lactoylglutathione lyase family enzyme
VSAAEGLDHVGVVTADLRAASRAWRRLGFALTRLARHAAPAGTGNRCAMLRSGYVELIAVVDSAKPSAMLERFLARYAGIHILSLAISDEQAALARLRQAGFAVELVTSERPAEPAKPKGPQARFARLPLTDAEPRLQLLRHLTPELVWQKRFLRHPNHAVALEAVVIVADPPAVLAARLSRAAGVPVVPDAAGGYALRLSQGQVRVLAPGALAAVFPGVAIPSLPFVAGIVVRTDDGAKAVTRLLKKSAVRAPGGLLAAAAGVAVLFTA